MLYVRRRYVVTLIAGCLVLVLTAGTATAKPSRVGRYPDLRTVVPTHVQLVNRQQRPCCAFRMASPIRAMDRCACGPSSCPR